MLPEGKIKDKIMLFFFKPLKNRYLQVLINKENSTLGYYFVATCIIFLLAPNGFDVKDGQPLNVCRNKVCLYLKCFLRSYRLQNSGCHSECGNNI